jgi:hypothetical protein
MDDFQELRKKCIEIMGEADFNRLMNQFDQSSDKEKVKIEEFLNDLIIKEMENKQEDENIALDETQKLTKTEVEEVLKQAKEKSKDILK